MYSENDALQGGRWISRASTGGGSEGIWCGAKSNLVLCDLRMGIGNGKVQGTALWLRAAAEEAAEKARGPGEFFHIPIT